MASAPGRTIAAAAPCTIRAAIRTRPVDAERQAREETAIATSPTRIVQPRPTRSVIAPAGTSRAAMVKSDAFATHWSSAKLSSRSLPTAAKAVVTAVPSNVISADAMSSPSSSRVFTS